MKPALYGAVCKAATILAFLVATSTASAQDAWPSRPIKLVVPFPPGGSSGAMALVLADELTKRLGQQVLVDNRGGAGGNIGAAFAAKQAPDGYTFFWGTGGTHGVNPIIYKAPGYDAVKDFIPVVLAMTAPNVIVVNPSFPAKTLGELIAMAKAEPGKFSSAAPGAGSTPHMMGELLKHRAGVQVVNVPYQGGGPALADTIAGHVPIMFDGLPSSMPHIKSGKLRALAVSSATRAQSDASIPTVAETLPGFDVTAWWAVFAPAKTPAPIVERLNREVNAILAAPATQRRIADFGATTEGGTPERLQKLVASEIERWSDLMKAQPVKVD